MATKIGRNDLCPCNSGKKYKKCCLRKDQARTLAGPGPDRFRFEAGAYFQDDGTYCPAALSLERVSDSWQPRFMLANPLNSLENREDAAAQASIHLDEAYEQKVATGTGEAAALMLHTLGYKALEDFQLDRFSAFDPSPDFESITGDEPDSRRRAKATFLYVVDEQLRLGEPAETPRTYQRLLDEGHTATAAKELIAMIVATEVFNTMKTEQGFDEQRFSEALRRLPELPEELQDGFDA